MKQIMLRAAELIEKHGWWNGKGEMGDSVCAVMAITRASNEAGGNSFDNTKLVGVFGEFVNAPCISEWNDRQYSGHAVVDKLRELASTLKE